MRWIPAGVGNAMSARTTRRAIGDRPYILWRWRVGRPLGAAVRTGVDRRPQGAALRWGIVTERVREVTTRYAPCTHCLRTLCARWARCSSMAGSLRGVTFLFRQESYQRTGSGGERPDRRLWRMQGGERVAAVCVQRRRASPRRTQGTATGTRAPAREAFPLRTPQLPFTGGASKGFGL